MGKTAKEELQDVPRCARKCDKERVAAFLGVAAPAAKKPRRSGRLDLEDLPLVPEDQVVRPRNCTENCEPIIVCSLVGPGLPRRCLPKPKTVQVGLGEVCYFAFSARIRGLGHGVFGKLPELLDPLGSKAHRE